MSSIHRCGSPTCVVICPRPCAGCVTRRLPRILVGDIVLTEILQGARDEAHAARLEADLRQFPIAAMVGGDLATKAARHYRRLRAVGFTMNKIADLFIGTFCIEHGYQLLQSDADFEPMAKICGLLLWR